MSDKYLFTQTICPINIYLLKQYVRLKIFIYSNNMSDKYLFTQTICPINIYLLKQYVR